MADARSVVVTGAANGMGRAVCERLAKGGWQVLAVDLNSDLLKWAEEAGLASMVADVSSESDNARIAAEAERLFGGLDAAIFNAGITGSGSIDTLATETVRKVLDVNLMGPIFGIRACLPLLRRRKNSSIVITASTLGLCGDNENWAYSASKHAVVGLVRSLAREIGPQGIRVNAVCPGLTESGMTADLKAYAPEQYQAMTASIPLQRWASSDEQAAVMDYLISPSASFITGQALAVDGGAMVGTGMLPPAPEGQG